MSNIITYHNKNLDVHMSNGLTSVFISILGLSGSIIATEDYQKDLIVFLLEKDQSKIGIGTVGFDISEMPWKFKEFNHQKSFMLKVIDRVKSKIDWHLLDYTPNDIVIDSLNKFENMIQNLSIEDINLEKINTWLFDTLNERKSWNIKYPKCEKHGVFKTFCGCHICNDIVYTYKDIIRPINSNDRDTFISMADKFYHSSAVDHAIPIEHHEKTFNELMKSNPYIFAYMIEYHNKTVGYALFMQTYSNEAGGMLLWLDELFILEEYRGRGLGKEVFNFINKELSKNYARIRLELTPSNDGAKKLYQSMGFQPLEYNQMFKDL